MQKTTINLSVNDDLIKQACQLGGFATANDVTTQALLEYIQRRKQLKLLDLFGTVEYHDNYNTKEQRNFKT
jgi:Bacterial antitoxin of type II TA system, VapB